MRPMVFGMVLAVLLPPSANAQDRCQAQGKAEQDQILREYSGRPPPQGDKAAQLEWSKRMHAALAASAARAEECSRAARRAAVTPAIAAKEQDCIAASNRRADELQAKYRGKTMSREEQAARRAEEERLLDDRMACSSRARR